MHVGVVKNANLLYFNSVAYSKLPRLKIIASPFGQWSVIGWPWSGLRWLHRKVFYLLRVFNNEKSLGHLFLIRLIEDLTNTIPCSGHTVPRESTKYEGTGG